MLKTPKQTSKQTCNATTLLSKPPRTKAEADAQAEAFVKRDIKMLKQLAKID
jgi:hypothetical protein